MKYNVMFSLFTLKEHSATKIFSHQLFFKNHYEIKFCIKSKSVSFFFKCIFKRFIKTIFLTITHYIMITVCFTKFMDNFCDVNSQLSRPSISVVSA